MEPVLIETIPLDNGLTLEILDASRKIAADRWLVKVVARLEIPVSEKGFGPGLAPPAPLDQMHAKLGSYIRHEYHFERNFVDDRDKIAVLEDLQASILAKKAYYSHPSFGPRLIINKFLGRQPLSWPK